VTAGAPVGAAAGAPVGANAGVPVGANAGVPVGAPVGAPASPPPGAGHRPPENDARGAGDRDHALDVFKGTLVVAMVTGHVLQFFTDAERYAAAGVLIEFANVVAFPGFVFAFGYAVHLAYLGRPRPDARQRMLGTFLRILVAFYVSGTLFRVLVTQRPPDADTILPIVALADVPGWSEFLVSFALYVLLAAALGPAFRFLLERRAAFWLVCIALLTTTFLPYERVEVTQLGLLVGSTRFASFPVLQYLPFFLIGMYVHRYDVRSDRRLFLGAWVLTTASIVHAVAIDAALPGRFPPTLGWILLPSGFLVALLAFARSLPPRAPVVRWLAGVGARVLTYLLVSNLVIFAVRGAHAELRLDLPAALSFAAALLGLIGYLIRSSTRGSTPLASGPPPLPGG
jgi:surface polysaccharide O-acyltransferase-like enzyme